MAKDPIKKALFLIVLLPSRNTFPISTKWKQTKSNILLLQRRQLLHGHRVLIQNLQIHIFLGEGRQVILLLPLLKGQQQRPFPGVEPGVLQSLLDEFGLTGI